MATRKQLREFAHVPLPSTIPCSQCRIPKAQNQYSAKRLEDLQKHIISSKVNENTFNPKTERFICCSLCKGGPALEHQCYHCEITYPRTDRYFSKRMLKERKDEALCWSCSQREQNDTLSDGEESDSSCESDTTFVTNQFKDIDLDSTTSGHTSARGKNSNSIEEPSGGVALDPSSTRSTGPGTTWTGMSSNAGSSRGPLTSAAASSYGPSSQTSSVTGSSLQDTAASLSAPRDRKVFNPNAYHTPSGCSPPSSTAGSTASKGGSEWSKIRAVPTVIDMDAARNQKGHFKRHVAAKQAELQVSEDESD